MRINARVNGTIRFFPDIQVGIQVKLVNVEMFSKEKEIYVCPQHDRNFAAHCLFHDCWPHNVLLHSARIMRAMENVSDMVNTVGQSLKTKVKNAEH